MPATATARQGPRPPRPPANCGSSYFLRGPDGKARGLHYGAAEPTSIQEVAKAEVAEAEVAEVAEAQISVHKI